MPPSNSDRQTGDSEIPAGREVRFNSSEDVNCMESTVEWTAQLVRLAVALRSETTLFSGGPRAGWRQSVPELW